MMVLLEEEKSRTFRNGQGGCERSWVTNEINLLS